MKQERELVVLVPFDVAAKDDLVAFHRNVHGSQSREQRWNTLAEPGLFDAVVGQLVESLTRQLRRRSIRKYDANRHEAIFVGLLVFEHECDV